MNIIQPVKPFEINNPADPKFKVPMHLITETQPHISVTKLIHQLSGRQQSWQTILWIVFAVCWTRIKQKTSSELNVLDNIGSKTSRTQQKVVGQGEEVTKALNEKTLKH